MLKESRKPAQKQFIRDIGKTPETFIKQLSISGKDSTKANRFINPDKVKGPNPKGKVR